MESKKPSADFLKRKAMIKITEEKIKMAARIYSNGLFTNTNAAADFESGFDEGAKWMQEQMQPEWKTVNGIADLPTDNETYWCEIGKKVVLLEAASMRRGVNKVKRYLPFITPIPPQ